MKVPFNKAVMSSLPVGTHQDSKCPGLVLNVTPSSRRFGVYISVRNNPTRKSIGPVEQWSVEAARTEARKIIQQLRGGERTPTAPKVLLGQLASMYTAHLVASGRRTTRYMDDAMRLNWSHLADRPVADITVVELAEEHNRIVKARGPSAARRAILTLRTLYAYAASLEITERNPAKRVRAAPERSRDVFLTEDEIVALRRVLKTMPRDAEHFFLLALLTGLRRSNVSGMRWEWVDLEGRAVRVPAEASKSGEPMEIPLVAEAVELLRGRARDGEWVFPAGRASGGHLVEVWFWLDEVRGKMAELGYPKQWTIHDLRRTLATRMTRAGAPLAVVAKMLAHRSVLTTPVYARADLETVREWLV